MLLDNPLFTELEAALTNGSRPKRFTILRKMTDLFLSEVDSYSDDHIAIFDELMGRLINEIERQALVELSNRLAPADRAPVHVIGRLSRSDDIEIARPLLQNSKVLTDRDLVEIAVTKGQAHLSAIADRVQINERVADVLIDRGDSNVARKVTANHGARFSRFGLKKAVERAEGDESLALVVGNRADLPPDLLERLVQQASETVRQRLLAGAAPEMKDRVAQVVSKVSDDIARSVTPSATAAGSKNSQRLEPSRLRARIAQCAEDKSIDQLIEAFSALAEVPIKTVKDLVRQQSEEGLMILGKACGLAWPDMHKVLSATMPAKTGGTDIDELFGKFKGLSAENTQRAVRFIRTNSARSKDDLRASA